MKETVTVITTVYNGERYLHRSVRSVLAQSRSDLEYVIVDDGSTDGTPALVRQLAREDGRIRAFFPGRVGRVPALNLAVEEARGSVICNLDADDASLPGRVAAQLRFMRRHPDVGVVGGYYVVQDDTRGERYVRMPPLGHAEIVRALARRIPFAHSVVAFRKSAWEAAGGYPPVDDVEDLLLWIAVAKAGWRLANLPEVLGEHWVHPDSFWHRNWAYGDRQRKIRRAQIRAIRELGLPAWSYAYPAGRLLYGRLPTRLRRLARRTLGGSVERPIGSGGIPGAETT